MFKNSPLTETMEPLSARNTVAGVRSIVLVKKTGDRASGKQKQSYTKGFEEITAPCLEHLRDEISLEIHRTSGIS